jgi:hypothetical protein
MKSNRRTNSEGDDEYEHDASMSSRESSLNQIDEQEDMNENIIHHNKQLENKLLLSANVEVDVDVATVSFDLMSDDEDEDNSESDYSDIEDDENENEMKSSSPTNKITRKQFSSLSKLYISNDSLHVSKRQPHIIYLGVEPSKVISS